MGSLDDIALYETDTSPEEFVEDLWNERMPIDEMMYWLDQSESTIRRYLKKLNLPACFEKKHYLYNSIVLLKNKGYTIHDIAEELGKTPNAIGMIFQRKKWKKVTIAL